MKPLKVVVTGCAGFIGSHVVDRLLSLGATVVGIDNLSTGKEEHLDQADKSGRFGLLVVDIEERRQMAHAMRGADAVFHLAANADVRDGLKHPLKDLRENTVGTFNVLEAMRDAGVKNIVFASTGSVYGEPKTFPTSEDAPFPEQTSLYGASKVAAEGLISAYCQGYGFSGHVFRFVSVLGPRYTHGHVIDFYRQLCDHPDRLSILGDGKQRKSYIHVDDCIAGIFTALTWPGVGFDVPRFRVFNLGTDETVTVEQSALTIASRMGVNPDLVYSGGERGWVGDSPMIHLHCGRIRALGWTPKRSIRESIEATVDYLKENE